MQRKIQIDELGVLSSRVRFAPEAAAEQPQELPGYHVNATAPVPGWEAYRVSPSAPRRVFASGKTECYTFPSLAAFKAAFDAAELALPEPCPQVVTRRQARQALLLAGVLPQVSAAIAAIADPVQRGLVQIEWDDSQTFERNRPTLVAMAAALGMDDEALDQMFTTAAGL